MLGGLSRSIISIQIVLHCSPSGSNAALANDPQQTVQFSKEGRSNFILQEFIDKNLHFFDQFILDAYLNIQFFYDTTKDSLKRGKNSMAHESCYKIWGNITGNTASFKIVSLLTIASHR